MKVAFIVRSLDVGGAERQIVTIAGSLAELGVEVHVATFYGGGALEVDLDRHASVRLHDLRKSGRWDVARFGLRLRRLIATERFDAVYSFMANANLASLLAYTVRPRPRIVWGVRSSDMDLNLYPRLLRLTARTERTLAGMADNIVFNSMAGLRHYEERGYPRQALRYVPNGIDCERFSFTMKGREMVRRDLGIPLDSRVIGLFARVDPKKDHTTFLSAAERLHRDEPDVHFLCAGGVNKENLERYSCLLRKTKSLGLGGVVHWIGVQAAPELCMSGCDITTLTSAFGEGFPNVVAESMACEVPCVSTEVGDASIIIGDNGVVVRRSDPEALSEAWRKLLALTDDDRRALGRKARESIVDRFSVRQAAESTLDVLSGRDEVATSA